MSGEKLTGQRERPGASVGGLQKRSGCKTYAEFACGFRDLEEGDKWQRRTTKDGSDWSEGYDGSGLLVDAADVGVKVGSETGNREDGSAGYCKESVRTLVNDLGKGGK